MTNLHISALSTLLVWSLSSSGPVAAQNVKLAISPRESIGTASAGWACLPSGTLHIHDFVTDDAEMKRVLQEIWQEKYSDSDQSAASANILKKLSITLTSAHTKLCAKSYGVFGLGNRSSLSGRAEFTFSWSIEGQAETLQPRTATIYITRDKKTALPPAAIFREAVRAVVNEHLAR